MKDLVICKICLSIIIFVKFKNKVSEQVWYVGKYFKITKKKDALINIYWTDIDFWLVWTSYLAISDSQQIPE